MSASKPVTPSKPTHGTGVEKAVPKDVQWGSVRDNHELAAKHRPPRTIKLPSGATRVAPFDNKGRRMFLPKE